MISIACLEQEYKKRNVDELHRYILRRERQDDVLK